MNKLQKSYTTSHCCKMEFKRNRRTFNIKRSRYGSNRDYLSKFDDIINVNEFNFRLIKEIKSQE